MQEKNSESYCWADMKESCKERKNSWHKNFEIEWETNE